MTHPDPCACWWSDDGTQIVDYNPLCAVHVYAEHVEPDPCPPHGIERPSDDDGDSPSDDAASPT